MSFEWPVQRLDQIAEINPTRKVRKGSAVPFVDMAALPQFSRDIGVNDVVVREAKGAGAHFKNGDTLLARITPCLENGKTAQVRCLDGDAIAEGSTEFIVLCGKDPADNDYIYYLCREPAFREYAIGRMEGTSGRQRVSWQSIAAYQFAFPPPDERKEIARVLSTLDDRITLLRETNATLEAIAQALFKSWFVDFDPVRAKMAGHPPEGMDAATAALFPDSLEESEQGLVPKGWTIRPFIDAVDVIGGGTPKTSNPDYWGGQIPWFSVVDAPDGANTFVVDTEKHITDAGLKGSSTKLLPQGTTIISARGTVGKLALTWCPMAMNQSCYGLRGKSGDSYFTYFSTYRLVETLKARSHGSVFDTITRDTLASVQSLLPANSGVIDAFEDTVKPLMDRILLNLHQSRGLAKLRDTLLPRLISGQLRLPEAPTQQEAAA